MYYLNGITTNIRLRKQPNNIITEDSHVFNSRKKQFPEGIEHAKNVTFSFSDHDFTREYVPVELFGCEYTYVEICFISS